MADATMCKMSHVSLHLVMWLWSSAAFGVWHHWPTDQPTGQPANQPTSQPTD